MNQTTQKANRKQTKTPSKITKKLQITRRTGVLEGTTKRTKYNKKRVAKRGRLGEMGACTA